MRAEHLTTARVCTETPPLDALWHRRLWAGCPLFHVTTMQLVDVATADELDERLEWLLPDGRPLMLFDPEPTPRNKKDKSRISSSAT
jgi:hypothetical protein